MSQVHVSDVSYTTSLLCINGEKEAMTLVVYSNAHEASFNVGVQRHAVPFLQV